MKLKPEQLTRTLSSQQQPLYWLAGDEPLIMQESADQVRAHYRQAGFLEREVFNVDKSFDWSNFRHSSTNLSLFSAQKIIELRFPTAKLDEFAKKALKEYLEDINPDFLILISSPKLESSTLNTKWFKEIESKGALVQIWPVNRDNLGAWLHQRLTREGINAQADAIQLLSDKVEGNLLAATQEIEKLKLLAGVDSGEPINLSAKMVMQLVADNSRYNVYHLVDAALSGDVQRAQKMLVGLRNEGTYPLIILGAISRELRSLLPMVEKRQQGQAVSGIVQSAHVWFNRKQAVTAAVNRLSSDELWALLNHSRQIDQSIKGLNGRNTWDELSLLLLRLSGNRTVATLIAS